MHALCWIVVALLPAVLLPTVQADGRLRMCPPGGSSFTMAWSMACSMKRKKRDVGEYLFTNSKRALIAPSIRQLQKICCNVGCTVSDLLSYCGPLSGW